MTTTRWLQLSRLDVRASVLFIAIVCTAPKAWSQSTTTTDWRHGTSLAGFVGAATGASDTAMAAGATVGWELVPHLTLEGRGIWLDVGHAADAFAGVIGARVPILPARPVVPFVSTGIGLYRATFDAPTGMPGFYRRRMVAGSGGFQRQTFDDFVVTFGTGADISLARHLALRPDVTVLLVTARSARRAVPVYGVQLAYHFESRPITPARRGKSGDEGVQ